MERDRQIAYENAARAGELLRSVFIDIGLAVDIEPKRSGEVVIRLGPGDARLIADRLA
jgi:hypothetical protein